MASVTSPPLSATSIIPPPNPPVEPKRWHWRCHLCHRHNPIACGNRCLNCSHRFCAPPSSTSKKPVCTTNFEYRPWSSVTEWRRDTLEYASDPNEWTATTTRLLRRAKTEKRWMTDTNKKFWIEEKRRGERKKLRLRRFRDRTHDCSIDCSYPSECTRERRRARIEESSSDSSTEEESADDDKKPKQPARVKNSNGRVPLPRSLPSRTRSPSPARRSHRGKARRFRHIHFQKVGTPLKSQVMEPVPESPKSPESP